MVARPRLIERLNEGKRHKLTLISAPAGFGKTTLVSEWAAGCERPTAWLSLDEGDNDPTGFLVYLVAALQTINARIGQGVLGMLQSPQPPSPESILTALLNEVAAIPDSFALVLDDYHLIEAQPVNEALTFLIEHLPRQMHLVITTREDPQIPLARLRARDQLTELRATDLSFTLTESTAFLNQVMGLNLLAEDIAALETRTEGWIAGLQLAALSMRGQKDLTGFIKSFTGSHHFVLDYLVEEVLQQQPENVQTFLLRTSVLDRLCGPLCDAVTQDSTSSGQEILDFLERANLFIIPLDNERHWYRYQHLFADLLRQRLRQSSASSTGVDGNGISEYHLRASQWYEDNGLEIEAFHHAAAANDIERAERLIDGKGMPLHYRGAITPVLHWFESLPEAVLDGRPSLWVTFASATMLSGHPSCAEPKLLAAEKALLGIQEDDKIRDLIGQIAATRALVATSQNDTETIIRQSQHALEYLHPNNLSVRTLTAFTLGVAYELQNDRAAASRAYSEVISIGQASGNFMFTLAANSSMGGLLIAENQLHKAYETYQHMLDMVGDPMHWTAFDPHYSLARILYEWNDLDAAEQHVKLCIQLAPQVECDTIVSANVLLARLKLVGRDVDGAAAILSKAYETACQHHYANRLPEIVNAQVSLLIHQGNVKAAAALAEKHNLPTSLARVHLAQGNASAALTVLEPLPRNAEANHCADELLKVMVLQAVALYTNGEKGKAVLLLGDVLALAEPGGFIRLFVDEGALMKQLLAEAMVQGITPDYTARLLAKFDGKEQTIPSGNQTQCPAQPLIEPLSLREMEILQLISQGLSNREISERLFLALDTVKGHNRRIFDKLQVQRRTEAVARAHELDLV